MTWIWSLFLLQMSSHMSGTIICLYSVMLKLKWALSRNLEIELLPNVWTLHWYILNGLNIRNAKGILKYERCSYAKQRCNKSFVATLFVLGPLLSDSNQSLIFCNNGLCYIRFILFYCIANATLPILFWPL